MDDQALAMLGGEVSSIIWGTVFCLAGIAACAMAAARRLSGVRLLAWLGIWSATYGARMLLTSTALQSALPHGLQRALPYADVSCSYLLVVVGLLAWLELSRGGLRLILKALIAAGMAVGVAGIGWFVMTGSHRAVQPYNTLVAVGGLLVLVTVVVSRPLSDRYLILVDHRVLAVGTLLFAVEALYAQPRAFSRLLAHAGAGRAWVRGAALRLHRRGHQAHLRQRAPPALH